MEVGLIRKYDTLSQRHGIYLVVQPFNAENVEMVLMHDGLPHVQEIIPFEEEAIINAATKLVREADIAALLKLIQVTKPIPPQAQARLQ